MKGIIRAKGSTCITSFAGTMSRRTIATVLVGLPHAQTVELLETRSSAAKTRTARVWMPTPGSRHFEAVCAEVRVPVALSPEEGAQVAADKARPFLQPLRFVHWFRSALSDAYPSLVGDPAMSRELRNVAAEWSVDTPEARAYVALHFRLDGWAE